MDDLFLLSEEAQIRRIEPFFPPDVAPSFPQLGDQLP